MSLSEEKENDPGIIFVLEDGRLAGPQIYVTRLCKALDINCRVFFPKSRSSIEFGYLLEKSGINYSKVYMNRLSREPLRLIFYFLSFLPEILVLTVKFLFSAESIVYCAGGSWQIKAAIAGKLARKKVVWHLNDTFAPSLILRVFNHLSFLADGYVHASEATNKYYKKFLSERPSMVIPAPVDIDDFSEAKKLEDLSFKRTVTIGTVSNINPIKNLEDFIEVAAILNNEKSIKFKFVIYGPIFPSQKDYYNKLQKKIIDLDIGNLSFFGPVDNSSLALNEIDIFLFTSKFESSPMVVWEAMMGGVPIVSYKVGDIPRFVNHKRNGMLADKFDQQMLIESIKCLIFDFSLLNKVSKNARKTALNNFSNNKCAELHVEYLSRLI